MNYGEIAVQKHKQWQGKIEVICRAELETKDDLSIAYTPGVAQPCLEIEKNPDLIYDLTRRGNLVAVVTDGTAVLGLGDIGPLASMPVMEGKCALFKAFGRPFLLFRDRLAELTLRIFQRRDALKLSVN